MWVSLVFASLCHLIRCHSFSSLFLSRCLCTSWILIEIYCLWTGDRNQISSPAPDLISIDLSFDDDVTGGLWYAVNIGLCLNNICLIVLSVTCRHVPTHFQMYFLSLSVNSILLEFSFNNQLYALTKSSDTVSSLCSQLILCQCWEVHLMLHSWLNPVLRMSPWFCSWMFSAAANQSSVSCYFARVSLFFYFVFMR